MTDVLIRNVDEATLERIDIAAEREGLSRNEFLRRQLDVMMRPDVELTMDDLRRSVELASGALDDELMRQAWGG